MSAELKFDHTLLSWPWIFFINLSHFIFGKTDESFSARTASKNDLWCETPKILCGPKIISFYCEFLGLPYGLYYNILTAVCQIVPWSISFLTPMAKSFVIQCSEVSCSDSLHSSSNLDHYKPSVSSLPRAWPWRGTFFKIWKYPLTLTNCNERSKVDFQFTKLLYPEAKCT